MDSKYKFPQGLLTILTRGQRELVYDLANLLDEIKRLFDGEINQVNFEILTIDKATKRAIKDFFEEFNFKVEIFERLVTVKKEV